MTTVIAVVHTDGDRQVTHVDLASALSPVAAAEVHGVTAVSAGIALSVGPSSRALTTTIAARERVCSFAAALELLTGTESHVVLGPSALWTGFDLSLLGVILECNGTQSDTGTPAEALGDPFFAVVAAAAAVDLSEGGLVYTGRAVQAANVRPGDAVTATFARLGAIHHTVPTEPDERGA